MSRPCFDDDLDGQMLRVAWLNKKIARMGKNVKAWKAKPHTEIRARQIQSVETLIGSTILERNEAQANVSRLSGGGST